MSRATFDELMARRVISQRRRRACLLTLSLAASVAACGAEREPVPQSSIAVRDSIRVRRSHAMQARPDSFGLRVDSLRILRGAAPANNPGAATTVPLWIVIVSDFQCNACRRFALDVVPALRRDITLQPSAINLAFVNSPQAQHFNARFAALAALCAAASGHFWEMHDSLFATLPRWERTPDPRPFMDSLAVAIGAPPAAQRDCVARDRLLALLEGDQERSARSGATDLPTVFVGDRRLAAAELTIDGVRRAIVAARTSR